jgi:hypothetical protein
MNDSSIDWRNLAYSITMQLVRKVHNNSDLSSYKSTVFNN